MEQQSLLSDVEFNPVLASVGQRFLNYVIDRIVFFFLIFLLAIIFNQTLYNMRLANNESEFKIEIELISVFLIFCYYFLCETIFKGRTIGKFITGTRVIMEDGTQPSTKAFLLRSLSRIVPFEPFSALGNPPRPWHDKWSKTFVIDIKKTDMNDLSQQY